MLGGFTRSLDALVHFTLHTGAGVDSVVYNYEMGRYTQLFFFYLCDIEVWAILASVKFSTVGGSPVR